MVELTNKLILRTFAQSADSIARPTFVTDLDFTQPNGGLDEESEPVDPNPPDDTPGPDNTDAAGKITLETTNTNFAIGSEFEVEVIVDSDDKKLNAYSIKVEYDPNLLQVLDGEEDVSGTQVSSNNTDFIVVENTVNNTTGDVILKAETSIATEVDGPVAEIRFRVVQEGEAKITVTRIESSLVDETSQNILEEIGGLEINTGSNIGTADEILDTPLIPGGTISPDIKDLPKSDLPFSGLVYIIIGLGLIFIGYVGKRLAKNPQK